MSLRDDHIDKLPWPRLGDTLFKQRRVTGNHVPRFATDKQSDYIQGYKRAAEILVEQLASNEREDYLVYPIVFLWRQYIELRLKQIISLGVKLGESEVLPPLSHDIMKLWSTGKTIVEPVSKP